MQLIWGIVFLLFFLLICFQTDAALQKKKEEEAKAKAKARKEELKMYALHLSKHPKEVDKAFLITMLDRIDAQDEALRDRVMKLIFSSEEEPSKNTNSSD